jgi:glutathione S-transferase
MHWLHGVRADKRPSQQKSSEERSFGGERISITFRYIGTFVELSTQKIWGQGAKHKERAAAGRILTKDNVEMESMIEAFGKENHQPDFNWDREYGQGFDVIDLVSEKTKLTLCDDKVANLRVRLSLSEKRIQYVIAERAAPAPEEPRATRYKFHPWTHGLSNTEKPIFRDVDEDASETEGDLAILFYLEKFYPFPVPEGASSRELHRATALIFTRASKSNELLFWWRELQAMHPDRANSPSVALNPGAERPVTPNLTFLEEFNQDLDVWEGYAAEAEFIAGDFWTIIDCAFWPVLDDIISGWEKFDAARYTKLLDYHQRVLGREDVQKTLEGKR